MHERISRSGAAAILALACLGSAAPATAEEEPPAPWVKLSGRNAGAVGTCSTDEIAEITDCYVVRCDARSGLTFAVQSPNLADFKVRRVRFEIGRFRQSFRLAPARDNELTIPLKGEKRFLQALESGAGWATMFAGETSTGYSTGFDLTGAPAAIAGIEKACRK